MPPPEGSVALLFERASGLKRICRTSAWCKKQKLMTRARFELALLAEFVLKTNVLDHSTIVSSTTSDLVKDRNWYIYFVAGKHLSFVFFPCRCFSQS